MNSFHALTSICRSRGPGLYIQTIIGPIMAANVNFTLMHDPSFIRTCTPYTCDPGIPIRDGRRAIEGLGSIATLEDVNKIREFIAKTEFRPLICPLISGPQIRHPPERHNKRNYEKKLNAKLARGEREEIKEHNASVIEKESEDEREAVPEF